MTCIPFIPEEPFGSAADFSRAVRERAGLVKLYAETPFSSRLGVQFASELVDIPCHVVNSDPILSAAAPWSVTVERTVSGEYVTAGPEHTHVPGHAHGVAIPPVSAPSAPSAEEVEPVGYPGG
jgi:hypothetical protein